LGLAAAFFALASAFFFGPALDTGLRASAEAAPGESWVVLAGSCVCPRVLLRRVAGALSGCWAIAGTEGSGAAAEDNLGEAFARFR